MMVKTESNQQVAINIKVSILFFMVCFIFAIINFYTPITELMTDLNPIDNRNSYPFMRNIISGGAISTGCIAIYIYHLVRSEKNRGSLIYFMMPSDYREKTPS
jgi:hypothetical protein